MSKYLIFAAVGMFLRQSPLYWTVLLIAFAFRVFFAAVKACARLDDTWESETKYEIKIGYVSDHGKLKPTRVYLMNNGARRAISGKNTKITDCGGGIYEVYARIRRTDSGYDYVIARIRSRAGCITITHWSCGRETLT